MKKAMINPSCQYKNQIFGEDGTELYNEGHNMWLVAEAVKRHLDAAGDVESFISRESQYGPSDLDTEADLTNSLGCDFLVALHSDATPDGTPGGGTWTFFEGTTHYSEEELADLPYPLEESRRLADLVQSRTLEAIRGVYPESKDKGVQEHWLRLRMLHKPKCPACLIEILFHTNPFERELLKDPDFHERVGAAIASAIREYAA